MQRLINGMPTLFYEEDGGNNEPQGGTSPGDGGKVRASEILGQFGGDAVKMAERLSEVLNDNYRLRERNRSRQEVPQGGQILTADQVAAWNAYQQLGKLDELKASLTERDTLKGEIASVRRSQTLAQIADAYDYKAAALAKLPSLQSAQIELREVTVMKSQDGKVSEVVEKRAFVKDGATETELTAFITARDPEFLPSLAREAQSQHAQGTPFPPQGSGKTPKPTSPTANYLKNTYRIPGGDAGKK